MQNCVGLYALALLLVPAAQKASNLWVSVRQGRGGCFRQQPGQRHSPVCAGRVCPFPSFHGALPQPFLSSLDGDGPNQSSPGGWLRCLHAAVPWLSPVGTREGSCWGCLSRASGCLEVSLPKSVGGGWDQGWRKRRSRAPAGGAGSWQSSGADIPTRRGAVRASARLPGAPLYTCLERSSSLCQSREKEVAGAFRSHRSQGWHGSATGQVGGAPLDVRPWVLRS